MNKFKAGDRVRIAESSERYKSSGNSNPKDTDGEVDEILSCGTMYVNWANGTYNTYNQKDLELVKSKSEFKVGHGAICVKKTYKHSVGEVILVTGIRHSGDSLKFDCKSEYFNSNYFKPCPNPPLPNYKERIAHALGADIELGREDGSWSGPINPSWIADCKYRVAIPDIHAEEREKIKREIAQLQKKLEGLGGDV